MRTFKRRSFLKLFGLGSLAMSVSKANAIVSNGLARAKPTAMGGTLSPSTSPARVVTYCWDIVPNEGVEPPEAFSPTYFKEVDGDWFFTQTVPYHEKTVVVADTKKDAENKAMALGWIPGTFTVKHRSTLSYNPLPITKT